MTRARVRDMADLSGLPSDPPVPAGTEMSRDIGWAASWAFVRSHLPPAPSRLLEIGCGAEGGFVPRMLRDGYDAVGVDPVAPAGPEYRQLEFERLEPPPAVDAVVACTSLHHVADLEAVLSKVAATLHGRGTLIVVEWDWERFDEQTARWCFDRLEPLAAGFEPTWLHRRRDHWIASGEPWGAHLRTWATQEGIHTAESMLHALDSRFERRSLSHGAYFFPDLWRTSEATEEFAIRDGVIQGTGLRYVGRLGSG